MENKKNSIATTAFLLLILYAVDMPSFLKYALLLVATVSLILWVGQAYHEYKAKKQSVNRNV